MNLFIICVVFIYLDAVHSDKVAPDYRRGVRRFAPKTDHEKELLKLVAERINYLLKDSDTTKVHGSKEDDINSIMSMVADSSPKIESEVRIFETLAHVIADVSEQMRKRSYTRKHLPSIIPKTLEVKSLSDSKLYGGFDVKKHTDDGKTIDVGAIKIQSVLEDAKKSEIKPDVSDKSREIEKPVLKLTPRVVFTDSNGNEYHLVGAGGRSAGSCTGQCLRIDADSKNVLAFKTPGVGEHLILSGHSGEELYTSGVQLCDSPAGKKSRNVYTAPNLALLVPKKKLQKRTDGLLVQWEDDKAPEVKRENPLRVKEFNKEVDALFKGGGLKNSPVAESQEVSHTAKLKNSRWKKHARLHARRRRLDPHHRTMREVANDDYYYDDVDEDSLVKSAPARTSLELKLLEDLKKDKKNLDKFRPKQNSQVDLEKCRQHCEALTAGLKKEAMKQAPVRQKRSLDNLDSGGDMRLAMSEKRFLKIPIEPKKADAKNGQGLLGEINMVQPESSPDEENRVLLKATGKPIDARQDGKIVEKLDANDDEETLPELIPATDSDELVYFPEDDDLGNMGDSLIEPVQYPPVPDGISDGLNSIALKPEPVENDVQDEEEVEKPAKPSSAEVGSQFAEAILFRVQNTDHMKKTLGVGLKFHTPEVITEPIPQHAPHYASTLQILLRTLMLNVEKIAEEDVEQRSCITLETELQDFLDEMIDLKSHPNMPSQYSGNIVPAASYSTLALRKNELLDLLREYHSLPLKAQQHAAGVKSFIEAEVSDIDKLIDSRSKTGQRDRFIRNTFDK